MFSGETMEEIFSAVSEVTNTTGQRGAEIATADETGVKELWGVPLVLDPSLPRGQMQIRHTDAAGRHHVVKVLDVSDELAALQAASQARRIGPQTAAEMLADFEFRKRIDAELVAESREAFERGEIAEDGVYEGDPLLARGIYRLVYESEAGGQKFGAWVPLTVDAIKAEPNLVGKMAEPQARHIIQDAALKFLRAQK